MRRGLHRSLQHRVPVKPTAYFAQGGLNVCVASTARPFGRTFVCLVDSENPSGLRVGNKGRAEYGTSVLPCGARCPGISVVATQTMVQKMRSGMLIGLFDDEEDEEGC